MTGKDHHDMKKAKHRKKECTPCCAVALQSLSAVQLSGTPRTAAHTLPRPSLSPRVCSHSCPWTRWCYLNISSSAKPFSFCLHSFPASGSLPMSQLFASGGQSIGASASVLSMNIQGWFPLGLTSLISSQSKGLSRVFTSTTIRKRQFFGPQLSLWSNSDISTWLLEKPYLCFSFFLKWKYCSIIYLESVLLRDI